jgi:hypothetical protein
MLILERVLQSFHKRQRPWLDTRVVIPTSSIKGRMQTLVLTGRSYGIGATHGEQPKAHKPAMKESLYG